MASQLPFLDLPAPVRHRIYTYLLAPHPKDNETVINYALKWNWLENPSNTTFGGIPQIDFCRCPRQKPRVKNIEADNHMYTRYKCNGPEVLFKSGKGDVWVPSAEYANSGQINFLRPAKDEELSRRPNANIAGTCRKVYEEALPVLYHGRNFLLVTGPCPRGRYQAYATQMFFARLSRLARTHITACSLTIVPHEEDCRNEDIGRAYADLVAWIRRYLPSFQTLGINLWDASLTSTIKPLKDLLQKDGTKIELDHGKRDEWVEEIEDMEGFRSALLVESHKPERMDVGPLWQEVRSKGLPGDGGTVNFALNPAALLERWRGKGNTAFQVDFEEDGDDWSEALPTPATSSKGKAENDDWDIVSS